MSNNVKEGTNKKSRIRILSTTDLHSKVFSHNYGDGRDVNYGLEKLSTIVDELRDENTILIDNGDVLEGSPLQFFHNMEGDPGRPSPISIAMGSMNYDFINLGNHDFNYGRNVLDLHIKEVGAQVITVNVEGMEFSPAIINIARKKIGIFGVVTQFIPNWEQPQNIEGLSFKDAFLTAKEVAAKIKREQDPDYIVCVYHGGFEYDPQGGTPIGLDIGENEGYKMINQIEDIDIFITGHQHLPLAGKIMGPTKEIAYTQSGHDGEYLSCIDIDTEKDEISPRLIKVEKDTPKKKDFPHIEEEAKCQEWLDQEMGRALVDLRIYDDSLDRLNKAQLITFINKVQMDRTGADLASCSLFYQVPGLGERITMRDLVATYVYYNTVVVKRISGKILREYLEKDMEFWTIKDGKVAISPDFDFPIPQHFNYDMLDGIEYRAKISNPIGQRIVSLTRNGEEIRDDMEFTIAISNYRAAGGGNFFMLRDAETIMEDQTSMVDILAHYIMEHKVIDFEPVHNIVIEV